MLWSQRRLCQLLVTSCRRCAHLTLHISRCWLISTDHFHGTLSETGCVPALGLLLTVECSSFPASVIFRHRFCLSFFISVSFPCLFFPSYFLYNVLVRILSLSFFLLLLSVKYWISATRRKLCEAFLFARKLAQWRRHETLQQFIVLYMMEMRQKNVRPDMTSQLVVRLRCLDCSVCTVCVVYVACRPVHDAQYRQSLTSVHISVLTSSTTAEL